MLWHRDVWVQILIAGRERVPFMSGSREEKEIVDKVGEMVKVGVRSSIWMGKENESVEGDGLTCTKR